jgi:hypothetical protein
LAPSESEKPDFATGDIVHLPSVQIEAHPFRTWQLLGFLGAVLVLVVKFTVPVFIGVGDTPWVVILLLNISESLLWLSLYSARYGKRPAFVLCILPLMSSGYACISDALLAMGLNIYPFHEDTIAKGMYLQSIYVSALWMFIYLLISPLIIQRFIQFIIDWLDNVKSSRTGITIFAFVGITLAVAYRVNFYTSGAAEALASKDRGLILDTMETGKVWMLIFSFVAWCMVLTVLLINQRTRQYFRRTHLIISMTAFALICFTYFQLGNRREMLLAVLFAGIVFILRGKARVVILSFGLILLGGMYLGITRLFNTDARGQLDAYNLFINIFGEAIFPNYSFLYHIESGSHLWLGSSYLRFPAYVLPSFGMWEKAKSLSELFAEQYGAGGMAYTHLGEGYDNFGNAAAVIVPLAIALVLRFFMSLSFLCERYRSIATLGLVFVAMSFDICRGEFVSNLGELLVASALLWIFLGIARIEIR